MCEGGPTLNESLLLYGLVDELFLTVKPAIAGGADALTIVAGMPLPELVQLELAWVLEEDGELYLRYKWVQERLHPSRPPAKTGIY